MRLIFCACVSLLWIAVSACGSGPSGAATDASGGTGLKQPTLDSSGGSATKPLENTAWKLTQLGEDPAQPGAGGEIPNITFDPLQKRASGFAGCNSISGEYKLDGEKLSFGPMMMTKKGCLEGMEQEGRFAKALNRTASWKITGDRLELFGAGGELLATFED